MKYNKINKKSHAKLLAAASISLGLSSMHSSAQTPQPVGVQTTTDVDTELLLLVDISGSIDESEYALMMNGYQSAFNSVGLVDAIQSGTHGSVAVSLMFWSGNSQQSVGVDWTYINDFESSQAFASAIADTVRPFEGTTAIGSAITEGTKTFGHETGNNHNGFSSNTQIIDISGDGEDNDTPPEGDRALNVRNARDAAMADGVDMINALPIGNDGGNLEQYYADNVIAGEAGEEDSFTMPAETFEDVAKSLQAKVFKELTAGGENVPEPSSAALLGMSGLMLILRRKR